MLNEIPTSRPHTPLLDTVDLPADLRQLPEKQLPRLAHELREYLLYSVGKTGGHFGAGLGVVELTIALHYVFNTPDDKLVWDVGHQSYPHKILTGRRERMLTMRQEGGLAAFNHRGESHYDTFGVGHSSTSISAALGMARGLKAAGKQDKVIAVIGDGAMSAGMAFEALNHAGELDSDLLIVLNDNNMSISKNVGGLSSYFARMWASKPYNALRSGSKKVLSALPPAWKAAHRAEEYMKGLVSPATIFEELGITYYGLIDGHDLQGLVDILRNIKDLKGPRLLHVVTRKGKGYGPAEQDPCGMHALNKLAPKAEQQTPEDHTPTYSQIFGQWLCDMAEHDQRLMAITPAMGEGSGMREFEARFPERFFDVAIAEQHAVTFGAGMACEGLKPVVAIYSTFLQRAYDQVIHDVALQNLDVLFAIDRAGLVGEDGPTHAGSFDLSYLRCIPNLVVMTPSDENETRLMLNTGYYYAGPAAVRYPRGRANAVVSERTREGIAIGKARVLRRGQRAALLVFGTLLKAARPVSEALDLTLVDMRFVKPLDEALLVQLAHTHELLVTLEENAIAGGAGSAVNEYLAREGLRVDVLNLGLPDAFLGHGKVA
ncbi:MAG: 1-deoxy-D-xylulose-5-phosphate synthase, partial [Pseudomonadales bacterium]|nr:1-deoxy-D-xylulose-5-phosphate synthase [Pseudomonadales bacterium]